MIAQGKGGGREWFDVDPAKATAKELGVKAGVLVHPTRLACTGKQIGPSLYHLMEVLGKDRTLARLSRALGHAGFGG